jgi:hypothetical protein
MTEVQEHSDHIQVEDKRAFHTDLACRRCNLEWDRGSWDRVELVPFYSGGTESTLDMLRLDEVVDLPYGTEEAQGLFLSSFLRANIPILSIT